MKNINVEGILVVVLEQFVKLDYDLVNGISDLWKH